jgi:hypothetical protein
MDSVRVSTTCALTVLTNQLLSRSMDYALVIIGNHDHSLRGPTLINML